MTTDAATPGLWRNGPFLRLWTGQTASSVGTQLGGLAIPVLAVSVLQATPFQVGLLGAVQTAAFLVIGLPAGAWVDRWLKRRVMLFADLARAVVLASVPILFFAGVLSIWQLIIIGAIVGVASVFFDVAYQSYLPVLVAPTRLAEGNSKLETTGQLARVAGPAISGALLAIVRPAILVGIDALTFLFSFLALTAIRDREVAQPKADRQKLVTEIREGLSFVFHEPLLRRIVLTTSTTNLFGSLALTMIPILVLRQLDISPVVYGIGISIGAVGGLLGAMFSARIARAIGEGTAIPVSGVVAAIAIIGLALMSVFPGAAVPIFVVSEFLYSFAVLVYNIAQVTFRQRICPPRLLGRMNASIRFVVWGVLPIGGLASGLLSTAIGLEPTIIIGAVGSVLACAFVVFSPLLGMGRMPQHATTSP
ncbi:MFS transporter [Frigoribacterium sp. UYMn621]|uniref:MFS transporter n=1 Tax=Frigoribacterium sp. UYMn621 TaxID=3156343 RepID=UPI0033956685